MKKKLKVHILPTEDNNEFVIFSKDDRFYPPQSKNHQRAMYNGYQRNYLYLTSDEKKEDGDWCIEGTKLFKYKYQLDRYSHNEIRKVVATNDHNLGHGDEFGGWYPLPQIPQSFLKLFCEKGGVWEVDVEYYPKSTEDNTIVISEVEEKMYSLKQLKDIIRQLRSDRVITDTEMMENWIAKNL